MFRAITAIAGVILGASAHAGTISISTGGTPPWTVSVPSLGISGAAPRTGYLAGSLTPFGGAGQDCSAAPCAFDGFWTAALNFTLPADTTSAQLAFSGLTADDRAVLELNGVMIGNAYDGTSGGATVGMMTLTDGGPNAAFSFGGPAAGSGTVSTGFNIGGSNTLLLIVNNTQTGASGSPSGIGFTVAGVTGSVTYTESSGGAVPEPASMILIAAGLPVLAMVRWRRNRRQYR
jgi:PEP-CTERM motif